MPTMSKEYFREYRAKNREKINKRKREWRLKNPQKYAETLKKQREYRLRTAKDPVVKQKRMAVHYVTCAVFFGDLVRPDECELCGKKAKRIEGHHRDYDKPLEVLWLCSACHGKEHAND